MPRQPRSKVTSSPVRLEPPQTRQQSRGTGTCSPTVKEEPLTDYTARGRAVPEGLNEERDRRFSCVICHRKFTSAGHLNRHERTTHDGAKEHPCPYPGCQTKCSRQDNLIQHYRIHMAPTYRRPSIRERARQRASPDSEEDIKRVDTVSPSQRNTIRNDSPPHSPPPLVPMPSTRRLNAPPWSRLPSTLSIPSEPSPISELPGNSSFPQTQEKYRHELPTGKVFYSDLAPNGHFHEEFPQLLCTETHIPMARPHPLVAYPPPPAPPPPNSQMYDGTVPNRPPESPLTPLSPSSTAYFEHTPPSTSAKSSYSSLSGAVTPRYPVPSMNAPSQGSLASVSTLSSSACAALSSVSPYIQTPYEASSSYPTPASYASSAYEQSPILYADTVYTHAPPHSSASTSIVDFQESEWAYLPQVHTFGSTDPESNSPITSVDVSFSSAVPAVLDHFHVSETPSPLMDCLQKPTRHQREMQAFYEQRERDQAFERQIARQRSQMQLDHERRVLSMAPHPQQSSHVSVRYPDTVQTHNHFRAQQPGSYPLQLAPSDSSQSLWSLGIQHIE